MAFEELREQLTQQFKDLAHRVQDSPAFQSLKEKFDDLPPQQQRLLIIVLVAFTGFFVLSFPYDSWDRSSVAMQEFEERRDLVRELLKVTNETGEATQFPPNPSMGQIKADMEMRLQQFQLVPEQLGGINVEMPTRSSLFPTNRQEGALKVMLKKLNLRQLVDIVAQLQTIHSTVKLGNLSVDSHLPDPRYLDATLQFIMVKIPQVTLETPEEPPPAENRRRGRQ